MKRNTNNIFSQIFVPLEEASREGKDEKKSALSSMWKYFVKRHGQLHEKNLEPKGFYCCLDNEDAQIEIHNFQDCKDPYPCRLNINESKPSLEQDSDDLIRIITFSGGVHSDVLMTRKKAREFGQYLIDFSSQ